ncbi:PH domain-containing protein [Denitratimonas sp. CY0512]|uniref:PH domain-containing protein n=1 Tax=Denitratimonas sp. CY0512 TaxID=3131940 RepID=UPI00309F4A0A
MWQGRPSQVLNANIYMLCALGALLVVPLLIAAWQWLSLRAVSYQATGETLTIRHGVLNRQVEQVELFRIKDLSLSKPVWQRMLGMGTIELLTSDQTAPVVRLEAIANSDQVLELLRSTVLRERQAKGVREIDR